MPMGEPPGLVPGGRGKCVAPITGKWPAVCGEGIFPLLTVRKFGALERPFKRTGWAAVMGGPETHLKC